MKLSEDLQKWRAERPDEWTMDRFIAKAIKNENTISHMVEWLEKNQPDVFTRGFWEAINNDV